MIIVHHLNESRSIRVLWLLEELNLPYEVKLYERNAQTRLAPPELKQVHPLGKSPAVEMDGRVLTESGAILEYLAERDASGALSVAPDQPARAAYLHWLHYAESSAVLPLMLMLYTARLGEAAEPLRPRINSEIENHLGFANASLGASDFFVDNRFTAADIQMSFVLDFAKVSGLIGQYPNLERARAANHQRPAFQRALERGGPYNMGA